MHNEPDFENMKKHYSIAKKESPTYGRYDVEKIYQTVSSSKLS